MSTINLQTTIERAVVVRVDRYELPYLALVTEAELHPDEEGEVVDVDADCEVYAVSCPARLSGLPENCHPDESEFCVEDVTPCEDCFQGMPLCMTETEESQLVQQAMDDDPMDYYEPPDDSYEECWA